MEDKLTRKPTRLQNFDYGTTGAYFITICTQDRQKFLSEIIASPATDIDCSTDFKSIEDGAHDVPQNKNFQKNIAAIDSAMNPTFVGDGARDVPQNKDFQKNIAAVDSAMNPTFVGDGAHDVPQIQLTKIGEIVEKHLLSSEQIPGVEIDEYIIMPDHIHAIIFIKNSVNGTSRAPSPTAANEVLPHIISTFKRFCHKEIGAKIFQRSYYDHVIRDRKDYEARKKYIYENPIKWYYDKIYEDE